MVCEPFGLKTTWTVFIGLASKPVAKVSSGLAAKPTVTVFSSLASKLVRLRRRQVEDGRVDATGCVRPCYLTFAVFNVLSPRGIVVI
jgi:hypothetical protein